MLCVHAPVFCTLSLCKRSQKKYVSFRRNGLLLPNLNDNTDWQIRCLLWIDTTNQNLEDIFIPHIQELLLVTF